MRIKGRKLLYILLTLIMMYGLFSSIPLTASAASDFTIEKVIMEDRKDEWGQIITSMHMYLSNPIDTNDPESVSVAKRVSTYKVDGYMLSASFPTINVDENNEPRIITIPKINTNISQGTHMLEINGNSIKDTAGNTLGIQTAEFIYKTVPTITTQPSSCTVTTGTTAAFSVTAEGPELEYRWQVSTDNGLSWSDIMTASGSRNPYTLIISSFTYNKNQYRCKVSNISGSVMSDAATLNITAPPSALPVCKIGSKEYTSFETALGEVGNNQTITLLADITHTPKVDVIGKTITFELNGKKLNIGSTGDRGLYVENGEVKLENAANGELNVNGHGVYTINGGKAEVHNIEMSASGGDSGAFAGARSEVTVRGNITVTTGNSTNNGAYASEGGKITVEGIITVPAGATYIMVGNSKKIQSGGVSNGGYLEYIDGTSIVKVKDTATAELKITGPAAMTLAVGYAATSSDIFTITGIPAPTVTKTSGDTKITWNNSTKKLDIAAGLVAGTYPVILKASAAGSPDVTHTFTLTVAEAANKAVSTGMQNFVKVETYSYGQFTDVNENAWYGYNQQKAVVSAFEYGLMKGNSNTIFNPMGDVRISEALAIAARVHSIYTTGTDSFVQGSPWYKVYVDYAIANGIIAANDFSAYDRAATRAEMAYIFSHALPKMEFGEQNTVNALPDVNAGTPYSESILTLYKAGVLTGSDDKGTFNPGNPISRAEAAAIISRVILPGTRASGKKYE